MKPSEIIDRVLTEVWTDESRFSQGDFGDEDGSKTCMLGALGFAAAGTIHGCVSSKAANRLELHIARKHIESMIGIIDPNHWSSIPDFNDSHTFEEAVELLEKARAQLQERGE